VKGWTESQIRYLDVKTTSLR